METSRVKESEIPYYDRASWSGVGKGYLERPFGPRVAGYK